MGELTTKMKQQVMLEALRKHFGVVNRSCKAAKISKPTYYGWIKTDPEFKKEIEEIKDFVLDEIENVAYDLIVNQKNVAMTIFALKTRCKDRGWKEVREVELSERSLNSFIDKINGPHEREY